MDKTRQVERLTLGKVSDPARFNEFLDLFCCGACGVDLDDDTYWEKSTWGNGNRGPGYESYFEIRIPYWRRLLGAVRRFAEADDDPMKHLVYRHAIRWGFEGELDRYLAGEGLSDIYDAKVMDRANVR